MNIKKQTRTSENADPHELNNPVPRVLLGLIAALVVWGVYYILSANPNSVAGLGDRRDPSTLVAAAPSENSAIDGKQLFTTACQSCHQASGQGLPGVFPPLAGAEWVKGDPAVLAQIVLHGVSGPIKVAGAQYNSMMPPFGKQFSDAELAAVLSYIRDAWGNGAAAIEVAAIQAAREATKDKTTPWAGEAELRKVLMTSAAQQ